MKVSFQRQFMSEALSAICTVTNNRTPKPILQCVHVEVTPDTIVLSATDLELSICHTLKQVTVTKPGDLVCKADKFSEIVRECPDESLTIETVKNQLKIEGNGSRFTIVTQSGEEFPPAPSMTGDVDFQIELAALKRMVNWTAFAVARESSRYAINGLLLDRTGEQINMVATDGRRLSCASGKVSAVRDGAAEKAIVPTKAFQLLLRLASGVEESVGVKILPNQILLRSGNTTISSSLIEGHFPAYKEVIPQDVNRRVVLSAAEFQSKLKQASLLTNEESRAVRMSFSKDTLELSSRSPEQGDATVTMAIRYNDEPTDIGFNPVFLLDVLRAAPSEEVEFVFKEASRPGVLRVGDDLLHVVMPVSL